MMGGTVSSEFTAPADVRRGLRLRFCACGYAANLEKAEAVPSAVSTICPATRAPEPFATPGQKTIDDLVKFTGESRGAADQDARLHRGEQTGGAFCCAAITRLSETKLAIGAGHGRPSVRPRPKKRCGCTARIWARWGRWVLQGVRITGRRALVGTEEHDHRGQPRRLPPPQRDAGPRFHGGIRGHPRRGAR